MVGATNHQWSIAGEHRICKVCGLVAHSLSDVLLKEQTECIPTHVEIWIEGIITEDTFRSIQQVNQIYYEDKEYCSDCVHLIEDCRCERCDYCNCKIDTEEHDDYCPDNEDNEEMIE